MRAEIKSLIVGRNKSDRKAVVPFVIYGLDSCRAHARLSTEQLVTIQAFSVYRQKRAAAKEIELSAKPLYRPLHCVVSLLASSTTDYREVTARLINKPSSR